MRPASRTLFRQAAEATRAHAQSRSAPDTCEGDREWSNPAGEPEGRAADLRSTCDRGFWYEARAYVWVVSVSSSTGFVPIFNGADHDTRFLGVRVKPMLVE